jgi:mRNA interferase RelE/StbE
MGHKALDPLAIGEHDPSMALFFSREATRALLSIPRKDRDRLRERLEAIAAAPAGRHPGVEAMRGRPAGRFRVRQGDWRAVFRIDGADVLVERVGNRGEVYR